MSVELSFEEVDSYIIQISTGERLFYPTKRNKKIALLFKFPNIKEKLLSQHFYNKALKEAEEMGLPSISDLEELVRKRGLFTKADEEKIKVLESKLHGQKAVLEKTTRVPARRNRLNKIIEGINKEISELRMKKESALEMSSERKATEEKLSYLAWSSVYDPFTDKLYWKTYEDYTEERDFEFSRSVFVEFIGFYFGLPQEILRYIARHNLWRVRYITSTKTGADLFGRSIKDYTSDQVMLLYWSHYYQSIYEMLPDDRPPDSIVEDDAALDAYMSSWHADKERDSAASRAKKQNKHGQKSAWDFQETLVMKSNPMYEDIEYSDTLPSKAENKNKKIVDAAPLNKSKQ
jgi:hypothetical protein